MDQQIQYTNVKHHNRNFGVSENGQEMMKFSIFVNFLKKTVIRNFGFPENVQEMIQNQN